MVAGKKQKKKGGGNNFATREQSVKRARARLGDKFPLSPICIRAICKPVCYIRARGEIKRKSEEGRGARAKSFFASCYRYYIPPRIKSGGGSSGVAIISIDRY